MSRRQKLPNAFSWKLSLVFFYQNFPDVCSWEPNQHINSLRPNDAYMSVNHHWFRQWLVAWSVPSHHLNPCWNIDNWTFWNKLLWNFNWNSNNFIQGYPFEVAVWKMVAVLSRPQWVSLYNRVAFWQMTISNAFSLHKSVVFWLKFESLFLRV